MMNSKIQQARYRRSSQILVSMIEKQVPACMIQHEARLLLEACYGGPWKTIGGLIAYRLKRMWESWAFMMFESVRTKAFGRAPSTALELVERAAEEDAAIRKMVNEL